MESGSMPAYYYELCRLCTASEGIKVFIFSEEGKRRHLSRKIHDCLPIQVGEDDLLPKMICHNCAYQLEKFYSFREGCVGAEVTLKNYLKAPTQPVEEFSDELKAEWPEPVESVHPVDVPSEEPLPPDEAIPQLSTAVKVEKEGKQDGAGPFEDQDKNSQEQYHEQDVACQNQFHDEGGGVMGEPYSVKVKAEQSDCLYGEIVGDTEAAALCNYASTDIPQEPYSVNIKMEGVGDMGVAQGVDDGSCDMQVPVNSQGRDPFHGGNMSYTVDSSLVNVELGEPSEKMDVSYGASSSFGEPRFGPDITVSVSERPSYEAKDESDSEITGQQDNGSDSDDSIEVISVSQERPSASQNRPSVSQNRPSVSQNRHSVSQNRPSLAQNRPSVSQNRPSVSQARPSVSQIRPSMTQRGAVPSSTKSQFPQPVQPFQQQPNASTSSRLVDPHPTKFPQQFAERSRDPGNVKSRKNTKICLFQCKTCGEQMDSIAFLLHSTVHPQDQCYICRVCMKSFETEELRESHLLLHSTRKQHTCLYCGKSFVKRSKLERHLLTHDTGKAHVSSDACGSSFKKKDHLVQHKDTSSSETYVCGFCHKVFYVKRHFLEHQMLHTLTNE